MAPFRTWAGWTMSECQQVHTYDFSAATAILRLPIEQYSSRSSSVWEGGWNLESGFWIEARCARDTAEPNLKFGFVVVVAVVVGVVGN